MISGIDNEDNLVRYLLGQLSEEERQVVEQRFFDDDLFYQRLLEVEDDLRCAYAQGTLPLAQKELFEKRFLVFADERKRVELAREMITELPRVSAEPSRRVPGSIERGTGRWPVWSFGLASPAMRLAAAAAVLVVVAGLFWLLFERARLRNQLDQLQAARTATEQQLDQRSAEERAHIEQLDKQLQEERDRRAQLEQELARLGDQAEQPSRPSVIALLLAPGRIRSSGETKRVRLPPGIEWVRLELELAGGSASMQYRALIMDSNGDEIWARTGLRLRLGGARPVVTLSIPARILVEDDYELKLTGLDASGQPERTDSYYFTVLKK